VAGTAAAVLVVGEAIAVQFEALALLAVTGALHAGPVRAKTPHITHTLMIKFGTALVTPR
jgi:hypothetical protein